MKITIDLREGRKDSNKDPELRSESLAGPKEFPLLEEIRLRQKRLNPDAFSDKRVKIK